MTFKGSPKNGNSLELIPRQCMQTHAHAVQYVCLAFCLWGASPTYQIATRNLCMHSQLLFIWIHNCLDRPWLGMQARMRCEEFDHLHRLHWYLWCAAQRRESAEHFRVTLLLPIDINPLARLQCAEIQHPACLEKIWKRKVRILPVQQPALPSNQSMELR